LNPDITGWEGKRKEAIKANQEKGEDEKVDGETQGGRKMRHKQGGGGEEEGTYRPHSPSFLQQNTYRARLV
jgi:hypothetical protein